MAAPLREGFSPGEAGADREVQTVKPSAQNLVGGVAHPYGTGQLASLSFDKGFTRADDRELLRLYVPTVVMPKRGRKNATETADEK